MLLIHELELKYCCFPDELLRPCRVCNSRQLEDDPFLSFGDDGWLAHTELVNAVADSLKCLLDRLISYLLCFHRFHLEDDGGNALSDSVIDLRQVRVSIAEEL